MVRTESVSASLKLVDVTLFFRTICELNTEHNHLLTSTSDQIDASQSDGASSLPSNIVQSTSRAVFSADDILRNTSAFLLGRDPATWTVKVRALCSMYHAISVQGSSERL